MEIDPSNAENPDQLSYCSNDQDLFGYARSYTCSFCKRGFSNAQALGGHMNIHRKDRARLKEFSTHDNDNPFSGITKMDSPNQPSLSVDIGDSVEREFFKTHETSCSPRRDRASSDQEVDSDEEDEHQLQLSLFTEASSTNNDKDKEGNDRVTGEHAKRGIQLSQCGSVPELDLELRLGTESPETSRKG